MWIKTSRWVTVDDLCGELWSGARERWANATDEQREEAFSRLEAYFDEACADDGEENAVEMVTVNDALWFDMDDIWDGDEDEDDEDEDDEDGDEDDFVDRYGIHAGRITCDGCHSVFDGNPFVDDGGSEYCSKECAEANGATEAHEDVARCMWCYNEVHGSWWGDNDGNFFCSKKCAIRYNLHNDETEDGDKSTPIADAVRNTMCLLSTVGAVAWILTTLF